MEPSLAVGWEVRPEVERPEKLVSEAERAERLASEKPPVA
jgi:hypothetical protein